MENFRKNDTNKKVKSLFSNVFTASTSINTIFFGDKLLQIPFE